MEARRLASCFSFVWYFYLKHSQTLKLRIKSLLPSPLLSAILFCCAFATYMSINSKFIRVRKVKIRLTNFSVSRTVRGLRGSNLPGCGTLRLHEVKRLEPASGMRYCAPKITEGNIVGYYLLCL